VEEERGRAKENDEESCLEHASRQRKTEPTQGQTPAPDRVAAYSRHKGTIGTNKTQNTQNNKAWTTCAAAAQVDRQYYCAVSMIRSSVAKTTFGWQPYGACMLASPLVLTLMIWIQYGWPGNPVSISLSHDFLSRKIFRIARRYILRWPAPSSSTICDKPVGRFLPQYLRTHSTTSHLSFGTFWVLSVLWP